jgi:hypothetical protein
VRVAIDAWKKRHGYERAPRRGHNAAPIDAFVDCCNRID